MSITVGVDVGGTFTDFVWAEDGALRVLKVPTTPARPGRGLPRGTPAFADGEDR